VTLRIEVQADAQVEFEEAAAWYESRRPGLGYEFLPEIGDRPESFPACSDVDPVRRTDSERFPYSVFFDLHPDRAFVLAIAHARRRPGYWCKRQEER
jgi:toxin ParE1/3/4